MIAKRLLRWVLASFLGLLMVASVSTPQAAEQGSDQCPNIPELRFFTQNTFLLHAAFGLVQAPYLEERVQDIANLIGAKGERYDIVGLQEVFWDEAKRRILKDWTGEEITLKDVKLEHDAEVNSVKLKAFSPNAKGVEFRVVNEHCIAGPDSTAFLEMRLDGGLMILSKYPIMWASAFIYEDCTKKETPPGETADCFASKGVLYARIDLSNGRNKDCYIHVFVTHTQADEIRSTLCPGCTHGDCIETRRKQLRELRTFIGKATKNDGHPIVLMGDFNMAADKPKDWGKKAYVISPSEDVDITSAVRSDEYGSWLGPIPSSPIKIMDVWAELHRDLPGFTWIGKDWKTEEPSPWDDIGNVLVEDDGPPTRLDYFYYFPGEESALKLVLTSIELVPSKPDTLYRFDEKESYTVSDHLGLEMTCEVTSGEYTVCPSGCPFMQIQAAIDAFPGQPIIVGPGTYHENLQITKSMTLRGVGRDQVTIIPEDPSRVTIFVRDATATIAGVTVADGGFGIWTEGSAHVELKDSALSGNSRAGIGVTHSAQVVIENNLISGNGFGIFANDSAYMEVIENCIQRNNDSGVVLLDAARATIRNNIIMNNGRYGVEASAYQVDVCGGNTVSNNDEGNYLDEDLRHKCSN